MRLGPPLPVVVAVASGCRAQVVEQRVLFVGNSYLFTNDLPAMFKALAEAKRHRVEVGMAATGGWALEQHAKSPETRTVLDKQAWTIVMP